VKGEPSLERNSCAPGRFQVSNFCALFGAAPQKTGQKLLGTFRAWGQLALFRVARMRPDGKQQIKRRRQEE
jgi:hypothetical protein